MQIRRSTLLVLMALVWPFAALALTNQDVIKMQKAGLAEQTILLAIKPDNAEFDTSPDALVELKNAGVSDRVIQKMLAPNAAPDEAAAAENVPAAVYAQDFPSIASEFVTPVAGRDYFTRYTLHVEDGEYNTTNYARGEVVPINTPVALVSMSGSKLRLQRKDNGQRITVENKEKYTKKSVTEVARLLLAADKTPLDKLPAEVSKAVSAGEMHKGMTKELVLMTRGYPPAHETPSLDGDRWVFWSSRFVKQTLLFAKDRLVEGRGLL